MGLVVAAPGTTPEQNRRQPTVQGRGRFSQQGTRSARHVRLCVVPFRRRSQSQGNRIFPATRRNVSIRRRICLMFSGFGGPIDILSKFTPLR